MGGNHFVNASFSTERRIPFALNVEQLGKLFDVLCREIGPTTIELQCADEVTRTYQKVTEAIEYENPKEKQIEMISLASSATGSGNGPVSSSDPKAGQASL